MKIINRRNHLATGMTNGNFNSTMLNAAQGFIRVDEVSSPALFFASGGGNKYSVEAINIPRGIGAVEFPPSMAQVAAYHGKIKDDDPHIIFGFINVDAMKIVSSPERI